jgi:hypothetical protein
VERVTTPTDPHTYTSGLRVPTPNRDRWILNLLRASDGVASTVKGPHILESTRRSGRCKGLLAPPTVVALIAMLETLRAGDHIAQNEYVALIATGASPTQVPGAFRRLTPPWNQLRPSDCASAIHRSTRPG